MTEIAKAGHGLAGPDIKPPLAMNVRLRLSVMMFLQFAVWGSWFTVFNVYCDKTLHFTGTQIGSLYGTHGPGRDPLHDGGRPDRRPVHRQRSTSWLVSHLAGAGLLLLMAAASRATTRSGGRRWLTRWSTTRRWRSPTRSRLPISPTPPATSRPCACWARSAGSRQACRWTACCPAHSDQTNRPLHHGRRPVGGAGVVQLLPAAHAAVAEAGRCRPFPARLRAAARPQLRRLLRHQLRHHHRPGVLLQLCRRSSWTTSASSSVATTHDHRPVRRSCSSCSCWGSP